MRIVSPFLKRIVYPTMSKARLFRRLPSEGLAVVTYHGVIPDGYQPIDPALDGNLVTADALRRHLRFLKAGYNVVSPEEVLAWLERREELPPRAVLLTCDDGLLNCLTDMLPVLKDEAVPCLFFVTGASAGAARVMLWYEELFLLFLRGAAGRFELDSGGRAVQGELGSLEQRRELWWSSVKRLSGVSVEARCSFLAAARDRLGAGGVPKFLEPDSTSACRFRLLNASELRNLASAGMTIGAHTMSHPMLSQCSRETASAEIAQSRIVLESILGKPVRAFAYPFGDSQSVTPEVMAMPCAAGFSAAFLNFGGGLATRLPQYSLPRIHVTSSMSLGELDAHVSGFYAWLQRRTHHAHEPALA
jgi:peptidoglycan/xylan/chitin deacetylase (PgdA/CDA1 family)